MPAKVSVQPSSPQPCSPQSSTARVMKNGRKMKQIGPGRIREQDYGVQVLPFMVQTNLADKASSTKKNQKKNQVGSWKNVIIEPNYNNKDLVPVAAKHLDHQMENVDFKSTNLLNSNPKTLSPSKRVSREAMDLDLEQDVVIVADPNKNCALSQNNNKNSSILSNSLPNNNHLMNSKSNPSSVPNFANSNQSLQFHVENPSNNILKPKKSQKKNKYGSWSIIVEDCDGMQVDRTCADSGVVSNSSVPKVVKSEEELIVEEYFRDEQNVHTNDQMGTTAEAPNLSETFAEKVAKDIDPKVLYLLFKMMLNEGELDKLKLNNSALIEKKTRKKVWRRR